LDVYYYEHLTSLALFGHLVRVVVYQTRSCVEQVDW